MFEDEKNIVCRLCLSSCYNRIDIFDPKGRNGLLVWKILKEILQLDVSMGDGLPATICESCLAKLAEFKYFKAMCINSRIEFLKVMANCGLVAGDAGAGLPFPKTAMDSQTNQSEYISDIIEIPEDRDPLEFLIDERADQSEEKSSGVKPKKSSSFAIGDFGDDDDVCVLLSEDEEDGAKVIEINEISDEDDDITIAAEDAEEEEMEEDEVGSGGEEDSEVVSGGTADSQSHAVQYVCHHRDCGREFGSVRGLRMHMLYAHKSEKEADAVVSWGCPFCDHKAGDRKLLAIHLRAQHMVAVASDVKSGVIGRMRKKVAKAMEPSSEVIKVSDVVSRIPMDTKVFECRVDLTNVGDCVGTDVNKDVVTSPVMVSSSSSQRESVSVENSSSKKNNVISLDPMFCHVCMLRFKNQDLLSAHVEHMHGQKKCYMCPKCSKSFKSLHQFVKHREMHRANKELMFWCNRCVETFSSSAAVLRHVKEKHDGVKPVVCNVCLCGFPSPKSVIRHACRLFGHMFPCPMCGKFFRRRSGCRKHVKTCTGLQEKKKK